MVSTITAGGPSHRAQASRSRIVLAGDRQQGFRAARRHSVLVKFLKLGLPVLSFALVAYYGAVLLETAGVATGLENVKLPTIIPENLTMDNPHYEGFNKDGSSYVVSAETAVQDLKNLSFIKLNTITGILTDADKKKTTLLATRGEFDSTANVLFLHDGIKVSGETGMTADLQSAVVKTREGIVESTMPVRVSMASGTVEANTMTLRQKVKEFTFTDNVRTRIILPTPAETPLQLGAGIAAKSRQTFGASDEPILVTSSRLDVNDLTKNALYTGQVKAVQGANTLTTPELTVLYEGSAVAASARAVQSTEPAASGSELGQSGGKLRRVVAKGPVRMTDAEGGLVTSDSADFDAAAEMALLTGNVTMTQGAGRRATSETAKMDQKAGTVVLEGNVLLTQELNVVRGKSLTFNEAEGKMQVTADGPLPGPARVSAHFVRPANAAVNSAKKAELPKGPAQAFGGSFKTDPNAPIDIEAARLDVNDKLKTAIFSGDVHVKQAEFVVRTSELEATYSGSAGLKAGKNENDAAAKQIAGQIAGQTADLTRIQARRKVILTSAAGQKATGDWADFDTKANMVTLGGNVVLEQGENIVQGNRLVIDMNTGESVLKSDGPSAASYSASADPSGRVTAEPATPVTRSGRPSAVFYPDKVKAAAGKAKDAGDAASKADPASLASKAKALPKKAAKKVDDAWSPSTTQAQ